MRVDKTEPIIGTLQDNKNETFAEIKNIRKDTMYMVQCCGVAADQWLPEKNFKKTPPEMKHILVSVVAHTVLVKSVDTLLYSKE